MADDDRIPECDYCGDDSGRCDKFPELDGEEERYFSITLREGFEFQTHIPCYARPHVCDFVKIDEWRENAKKDVNIKTKDGITVKVEVFNEPNSTYFDCPNWYALCKAYALEDDMQITFDLGLRRRDGQTFRNKDIWMLVDDIKLVLSPLYLHAPKEVRKMFDNTFHNGGFGLTIDEQDDFINVLKGVPSFVNLNNIGEPYTPYVPFVLKLFPGHVKDYSMRIPAACTPKWMPPQGELTVVSARAWDVLFSTDYSTEAGDDGCVRIRGWKRIVNRMNIKHGDKLFSILHNGMWGVFWFFFISPCGGDE